MQKVKSLIKRHAPDLFLRLVRSYNNREYNNLSNEQIFGKIYKSGVGENQTIHRSHIILAAAHVEPMRLLHTFNRFKISCGRSNQNRMWWTLVVAISPSGIRSEACAIATSLVTLFQTSSRSIRIGTVISMSCSRH